MNACGRFWYTVAEMKFVATIVAVACSLALHAQRQPFDRYQSIVERQMFGDPPPNFDPTIPPSEVSKSDARAEAEQLTKEQEQVKSAIHFSAITVTPGGETCVGFTDSSDAKQPKHYYLKIGEERDGWKVKEADPVKATMTIAKGDVEVSLSIGGNSAKSGGKGADAKDAAGGAAGRASGLLSPGSLRGRRRNRLMMDEQARQAEEERRRQDEALRQAEREADKAAREEQLNALKQLREELKQARAEKAANSAGEGLSDAGGESGAEE